MTGARLDPAGHLATEAYRPGTRLTALVKARDGRCRFPGCSVAARFCDLDHVRPWPGGPTAATNLLTLCRRHHRVKQRPGWRVRLLPDATATWTDPTGRTRTTAPLDALKTFVLTADTTATRPPTSNTTDAVHAPTAVKSPLDATLHGVPTPLTTGAEPAATAWSALESHLQFRVEHHPDAAGDLPHWGRPTHRRCTSAADVRAGLARRRATAATPDVPPF